MGIKLLQLFLSLSILIILHELGHFIPAKLFKTRIEKFYLFFDVKFSLFKKKIGDTVYGIGWLPLGGYVKISGMIDESMDKKAMAEEPKPWEFRAKPAWQRLIIMLGGVIVNVIVAFVIYILIVFTWGATDISSESLANGISIDPKMEVFGFENGDYIHSVNGEPVPFTEINKYLLLRDVSTVEVIRKNGVQEKLQIPDSISSYMFKNSLSIKPLVSFKINEISPNSAAEKAGLTTDSQILNINGQEVYTIAEMSDALSKPTDTPSIRFIRNGDTINTSLALDETKKLGIYHSNDMKLETTTYSFIESIGKGISYGAWTLYDYVSQLKFLFTKKGSQSLGGFVSISNIFPASWDWQSFWDRTAFLSIILAVMNVLPIPALDGGHVVFLLYEIITRRAPKQKVLEYAQMAGFIILMALLLYANGNDIYRFFIK